MKKILVISDHSQEAEHAAEFALRIARAVHADLLIVNTVPTNSFITSKPVMAGRTGEEVEQSIVSRLDGLNLPGGWFVPQVTKLDVMAASPDDLIALINRESIWLIVKGISNQSSKVSTSPATDIQSVLNRVHCPLLLVPHNWTIKSPERIAYLSDLRYCHQQILRYLGDLAAALDSRLTIAHLSTDGLVDMADSYADAVFKEKVAPYTPYGRTGLNYIRERDLHKAVDVLIHGLRQELLVMVNHRYHFEELIGRYIGNVLPADIIVPALIFPL